jgi:hypothetical protein
MPKTTDMIDRRRLSEPVPKVARALFGFYSSSPLPAERFLITAMPEPSARSPS